MDTQYTYLVILAASLAGPLLLSFDKKVAFFKEWKYVFPAMILPALFYILWDIYFTATDVWRFNPTYITGIKIFNLPLEEVLFFFVVPYSCVFIYVCIRSYFSFKNDSMLSQAIFIITGGLFLFNGIFFYEKRYTSFTLFFLGVFINLVVIFRRYLKQFNITAFLTSYAIMLIPFLIVNGFLTALPVVTYNNAENLSIRVYTIPVEDVFYGMLLVIMNIAGYEKLKKE